eukprot:scaffold2992_cov214-Amphora_coffeaeformis.AAC.3
MERRASFNPTTNDSTAKQQPAASSLAVEDETAQDVEPPRSFLDDAFEQTVERMKADMPWIMHGSGDVEPAKVNGQAAHFLASITAQYTAKLVDAALDAFSMFLNQDEPLRVPPPRFQQHRLPAKPHPLVEREHVVPTVIMKGNERKPARVRPKRKMREEYWDDPLPEPKIRSKKAAAEPPAAAAKKARRSSLDINDDDDDDIDESQQDVPLEEWVGTIGVDFFSDSIRRSHMPLALSVPSFIFPICHDVYAYGKVRHIQAAKRSLDPLLQQEGHLQDILQEEKLLRFKKPSAKSGDKATADEDEEEQVEKAVDPPSWPGIQELLLAGFQPDLSFTKK